MKPNCYNYLSLHTAQHLFSFYVLLYADKQLQFTFLVSNQFVANPKPSSYADLRAIRHVLIVRNIG